MWHVRLVGAADDVTIGAPMDLLHMSEAFLLRIFERPSKIEDACVSGHMLTKARGQRGARRVSVVNDDGGRLLLSRPHPLPRAIPRAQPAVMALPSALCLLSSRLEYLTKARAQIKAPAPPAGPCAAPASPATSRTLATTVATRSAIASGRASATASAPPPRCAGCPGA